MIQQTQLQISTNQRCMINITRDINTQIKQFNVQQGLCNVFIQHTSASLMICECADPQVQMDLENFMQRLVPDGDPLFLHNAEGLDDMPAHIRSVLTQTSISIPIIDGEMALGTWQGVFLWEHRTHKFERRIVVSVYN